MKILLEILLKDVPGQLGLSLSALEEAHCNVQSITHFRERKTKLNEVPVQILLEAQDAAAIEKLKNALSTRKIAIASIGEVKKTVSATVGVVGHVVHAKGFEQLISELDSTGVNVSDLKATMPAHEAESTAMITMEAESEKTLGNGLQKLRRICAEKQFLLVESL